MTRAQTTKASYAQKEAALNDVMDELALYGDEVGIDLVGRLERCQTERRARAVRFAKTGEAGIGWPWRCKSPACWSCRRSIQRSWQQRAARRFDNAVNEDCSFMTIVLTRMGSLHELDRVINKFRRDLRNIRDRLARQCAAWNGFSAVGHIELDAFSPMDVALLGKSRVALMPHLPLINSDSSSVTWVVHAHLSVHHPNITRDKILGAMESHWTGPNRVDVCAFRQNMSAEDNAATCMAYGIKSERQTAFGDGTVEPWPEAWVAEMSYWLHEQRRGLQPLQVKLGQRQVSVPEGMKAPIYHSREHSITGGCVSMGKVEHLCDLSRKTEPTAQESIRRLSRSVVKLAADDATLLGLRTPLRLERADTS